jgi:archaeosine-15-forming tRNA-guanine transglycosylase
MRKHFALVLGLILITLTSCAYAQQKEETKTPPQNVPHEFAGPPVAGTITSVGVDRFEIKKMDGSTQTVMVNERTRYRQGQQDIQLEDLKPGDRVFVRGQAGSNNQFVAEAVRRVTGDEMQPFQNAGERVFGEIVSIDKNQLKVSSPRQGERIVLVNDQTQFMKAGQTIALKDLKVGDRIFALGKETQGQFLATRVVTGQFRGMGHRREGP